MQSMMLSGALSAFATLAVVLLIRNFRKPEKEARHKVARLFDIESPQFKREMGALLGPAIVPGNSVEPLENGDEIFPSMLAAIAAAKRTITFETYIYWSGAIGEKFAEALMERARAGVRTHIMLDWVGCAKLAPKLASRMKQAGIELERYRPLRWYSLGRMNNRTHRKVLVIDGALGFTGGVGIADDWSGHAQSPEHWRDMHFKVSGPIVAQLQVAFLDNWIKTTGNVLHGEDYFPALTEPGSKEMQMFVSSPKGGSDSMRLMYLTAITAAARSIDIEAAYFIPDPLMIRELQAACGRGVRVRVLLPGKHIDSATARIVSKRGWGPLLRSGAQIHVYQPTMLHCKMLIFDGYMVSVGSTNFDMRSFELNDEASLNVYDAKFARLMTAVFERDLGASIAYTYAEWQRRGWREKAAESVLVPIRSQL